MLIKATVLQRIAEGEVDLAFRKWRKPTVKSGGTLQTGRGLLEIVSVERVPVKSINADAARRAGYATLKALLSDLSTPGLGEIYRIEFGSLGADPRIALREESKLSAAELETVLEKLARMDERATTPWTQATLLLIQQFPALRAGDLCLHRGMEKNRFKTDVRKLKNLGLTESLEVGYRLSPRGKKVLKAME